MSLKKLSDETLLSEIDLPKPFKRKDVLERIAVVHSVPLHDLNFGHLKSFLGKNISEMRRYRGVREVFINEVYQLRAQLDIRPPRELSKGLEDDVLLDAIVWRGDFDSRNMRMFLHNAGLESATVGDLRAFISQDDRTIVKISKIGPQKISAIVDPLREMLLEKETRTPVTRESLSFSELMPSHLRAGAWSEGEKPAERRSLLPSGGASRFTR